MFASAPCRTRMAALLCALALSALARAEEPSPTPTPLPDPPLPHTPGDQDQPPPAGSALLSDIKAYYTAPLHWDLGDWAWFGGSLAAIGVAHHYDTQVRTHFIKRYGPTDGANTHDLSDAVPMIAVLGGTWAYATFTDSSAGHREVWNMIEAAGLSTVTAEALKYAAGRERPYDTSDPNEWFKHGSSFPSIHSSAAFAIGTVLAESGNDEYRWLRRLLGYGLGFATSYQRLRHNAHWLSDTVAGAALGTASARFTLNRHPSGEAGDNSLALLPVEGGAMLTYRHTFN